MLAGDGGQFVVLWDEPAEDLDAVIEALWALHGEPFEISREEFQRRNLLHIQHEEGEDPAEADRAVA